LAHSAPAIVLALLLTSFFVRDALAAGSRAEASFSLSRFVQLGVVTMVVAAPLLWSIVWRYHLHVRNPAPMLFNWFAESPDSRSQLAYDYAWPPRLIAALVGLYAVVKRSDEPTSERRDARWLLTAWLCIALLLLGYMEWASARGSTAMLPVYHFMIYVKACEAILAGVGVVAFLGGFARLVFRRGSDDRLPWVVSFVCVLLTAGVFSRYRSSFEFGGMRAFGLGAARHGATHALYRWLLDHTKPHDVVLADVGLVRFAVSPAGRKVVVHEDIFSNPYVDFAQRKAAQEAMLRALSENRPADFFALADAYHVTHVVDRRNVIGDAAKHDILIEQFRAGAIVLYEVKRN
jgi:hypothetical protein